MVGIDVGATKITQSNRLSVLLCDDVPRDLLKRVADNRPLLSATPAGVSLQPAHHVYAKAVGEALRHQQLGGRESPPVAIAYPGWWGTGATERTESALAEQELNVLMVNDAEAAVSEFHRETGSVPKTVAVVSLRAVQAGVVIVRDCDTQPVAIPSPTLVHDEGGDCLDSAVLRHLLQGLTDIGDAIDFSCPKTISAASLALTQCQQLRESLSQSATESIRLHMPGVTHSVRLVRSELEEVVRPWADAVVHMVASAMRLYDAPVEAILLTGGLATMPLMSQRLSADLELEVIVPNTPLLLAARGADHLLLSRPPRRRTWYIFDFKSFQANRISRTSSRAARRKPARQLAAQEVDEFFTSAFAENPPPNAIDNAATIRVTDGASEMHTPVDETAPAQATESEKGDAARRPVRVGVRS